MGCEPRCLRLEHYVLPSSLKSDGGTYYKMLSKTPLHSAPSNHNSSILGIALVLTPLTALGEANEPYGIPFLGLQISTLLMPELLSHWGTSSFSQ